ncbi:AAA family ATPase [Paenibacillus montanisoli]|uniref:Stage V sporulation protein K n=1 Tax=Paenibacillus montanisoli TaxID=2081970 RepID=A0A328TV15_9BACL|nr:AAA family ATPase [Paenibacillus montanisoli]RAP74367.1 stage V sporulation protein K [Paenibacillus montanisoli]
MSSFQRWLRIVLPEVQIIDYVKQHGFRSKKKRITAGTVHSSLPSRSQGASTAARNMTTISSRAASPLVTASIKEVVTDTKRGLQQLRANSNVNNIDEVFDKVIQSLSRELLDQNDFIEGLTTAYKRAFLSRRKGVIQQTILLAGPEGTGKIGGLSLLIEQLYQQRLIPYRKVIEIDLSSYNEREVHTNFISDCAAAFEFGIGTVCLKGVHKAQNEILSYVSDLVKKGYFRTEAGITVEGTDHFLVFSIDESVSNEQDALSKMPSDIRSEIDAVILTQPLSLNTLGQIAKQLFHRLNNQLQSNAQVSVLYSDEVVAFLASHAQRSNRYGTILHEWIEDKLLAKLMDLRARLEIKQGEQIELLVAEHRLTVIINHQPVQVLTIQEDESLEELLKELNDLTGLENVKVFVKELMDTVKIQSMRKNAGQKDQHLTLHMIFSGNPGTGKTTVARLIGRLLKVMGILSKGQLIETARQDLVGEYVGSTAPKTNAKIRDAIGGVLFIDEAYTLSRTKNDPFGQEAIDTLVKGMEDHREDMVVILAGYTNEMKDFQKSNPGLPSRFPFQVEFPDYSPDEMFEICKMMVKQRGYVIDESAKEDLVLLFAKKQVPGRNDSGNGRLIRNLFEEAIRKQSARLVEKTGDEIADLNLLTKEDFGIVKEQPFNLEEHLNGIVGLGNVKTFLRTLEKQILVNKRRIEAGIKVKTEQSLNMIFTGNPGTGKTTIARYVAQMLKNLEVIKKGHLVEVGRTELVSGYVGQTAEKTKEVVESALGGVLFIDEAYALVDKNNGGVGEEAIHELVRLIEIHKDNLIVVLAGYTDEMREFLSVNPGLASRFPLQLEFPDYSAEETVRMTEIMVQSKGFHLEDGIQTSLNEWYKTKQIAGRKDGGNGRLVRNTIENAIRRQAVRIADQIELSNAELTLLTSYDFELDRKEERPAFEELDKIVGLDEVKTFVNSLSAQIEMNNRRKALGLSDMGRQSLHMVFKGNPGTGKTTIARIIAKRLKELSVVKTDKVVETDRAGLVAGFVGQTALKTKEVIDRALGGVLFIDEAYSLASDSFGKESIDMLVKAMEDHKDELVVIVAGYDEDMEAFLSVNPGLRSRFPNIITFADYSALELLEISRLILQSKGYKASKRAEGGMLEVFVNNTGREDSGNGRFARNLCEEAIRNHAIRYSGKLDASLEELTFIDAQDIRGAKGDERV